jgi:hypothetical protein
MTAQTVQEAPARPAIAAVPARVDANGSKWRLRSLYAMGHNGQAMATALGVDRTTVSAIVAGTQETITAELAKRVGMLWRAWWDLRPSTRTLPARREYARAQNKAAVKDWPTPANLDEEELDEPGYWPKACWHPATGVGEVRDPYPLGRWER